MKVAHVPVVYHVPPLMIHPFWTPPLVTGNVPLPEKSVPVGNVPTVEVVGEAPALGRYLIPVAGQLDLDPSAAVSRVLDTSYHVDHPRVQLTGICGNKRAGLNTAFDIEKIPNLVERRVLALDHHVVSSGRFKSGVDRGCSVGCGGRRNDACSRQELRR